MKFKNRYLILTLVIIYVLVTGIIWLFSSPIVDISSATKATTYFKTVAGVKVDLKKTMHGGVSFTEIAYPDGDLIISTSDISQDVDGYTQYKVANSPIIAIFPNSVCSLPDENFIRVNTAGSRYYTKDLAEVLEAFVATDSKEGIDLSNLKNSNGKPMFTLSLGLFVKRELTKISLPAPGSELYDDVVASLYYILNGEKTIKQEDVASLKLKVSAILKNANMVSNVEDLISSVGTTDNSILFIPEYALRDVVFNSSMHLPLVYNSKVLPSSTLYVYVNNSFDKDVCKELIHSLTDTSLWDIGFRNRVVLDPGFSSYKRYADSSINRLIVPIQDDFKELIGE